MTTIVQPGAGPALVFIQEQGLPLVVVQPSASNPVVVLHSEAPPVLYVAPQPPAPTVVLNPALGGTLGPQGALSYPLTAASDWFHVHAFGYPPQVRLVQDGQAVDIAVEYPDASSVYLTFPSPFTGTVILS